MEMTENASLEKYAEWKKKKKNWIGYTTVWYSLYSILEMLAPLSHQNSYVEI